MKETRLTSSIHHPLFSCLHCVLCGLLCISQWRYVTVTVQWSCCSIHTPEARPDLYTDTARSTRSTVYHQSLELQTKVCEDFTITEKAPTALSWLKVPTSAFTYKTLLRHYAERALTPRSLNVKLGPRRNYHKGRAAIRHYANQPAHPF